MRRLLIITLAIIAFAAQSCKREQPQQDIIQTVADMASVNAAAKQSKQETKYCWYGVAFYNQENLFDTIHDKGKNDYDFLPDGMYQWNTEKYVNKLKNMSRVLADLCVSDKTPQGAAIIGLAEVENRHVMLDLMSQESLKNRGLRFLHAETHDRRGIDCAMIYNPQLFQLEDSLYIPYIYPGNGADEDAVGFTQDKNGKIKATELYGDTTHITRGFLVGIGTMAGEKLAVIVNHWPSRGSESDTRERAAMQCKAIITALQKQYKGIKVIAMGDLNDNPDNKSLTRSMACKYAPADVHSASDIYNPWRYVLRTQGQGTLLYNGNWDLFDQIVMTGNLVDSKMKQGETTDPSKMYLRRGLTLYDCGIFRPSYIIQQSGKYKGGPKRTTSGGKWLNGYSDHFPTYIYMVKETK